MIETLSNIQTLKGHNALIHNNLIYVKGYYEEGDGGNGFFIYNNSETSPDTGGIFIKPNAVGANSPGRWIRQYSGSLNAIYFGILKYHDNDPPPYPSFSNSDRIQAAIDYIAENTHYSEKRGDMTLYFPNGNYFIDKTITLRSEIQFKGDRGTLFTAGYGSNYAYMFEIAPGPINRLNVENLQIDLNSRPNMGGFYFKGANAPGGGLIGGSVWASTFKNIKILSTQGHGIYLEGGASSGELGNQYILFEGVGVIRNNPNANCLKITGQLNTTTFLNCTFEIPYEYDPYDPSNLGDIGTNILITSLTPEPPANSNVVSFINCATGGHVRYGCIIENAQNITFDTCWFEDIDISFAIKNSTGINILNSRFVNAAGRGSLPNSTIPPGTGTCISVAKSFVNVENNYVSVTQPNSPNIQGETFIRGLGTDNVINASNNSFSDIRLSQTYGILQYVTITDVRTYYNPSNPNEVVSGIETSGKKLVFVNTGVSNQINRINSTIAAGEMIFLRANQDTIVFNEMSPVNEVTGKNIILNGRGLLTLTIGQAAMFIKIDGVNGYEKCAYQLVSISN